MIKERCHESTGVMMRQDIEKKATVDYNLVIKLEGSELDEQRTVSHLMLCKNNGALQLGEAIQTRFDCACKYPHCDDNKQIRIAAVKSTTGEQRQYSNILVCDVSKSKENIKPSFSLKHVHQAPKTFIDSQALIRNKPTLTEIMEDEIPKPHRPGRLMQIISLLPFFFIRFCTRPCL